MVDVCIIILTAFAIFGGFCFVETIMELRMASKMPPSVTFMEKSDDRYTNLKITAIWENIANNKIIFTDKEYINKNCNGMCEISKNINDVLFTKNQ